MTKREIKTFFEDFNSRYPKIHKIVAYFQGSGDSMDGYHAYEFFDENDKQIAASDSVFNLIIPCLESIIYRHNGLFDGDGSEGTITLNFKSMTISFEDNIYVINTEPYISEEINLLEEADDPLV